MRDVGGLNLAISAILIAAFVTLSRPMIITASIATLLYGIPHLVYHIAHTANLATSDVIVSIAGLALFAVVPIALIVVSGKVASKPVE